MNKPTKPGWYWLRQNYKRLDTGEIQKARWEVAMVHLATRRRSKKPDMVLWVATSMFGGIREHLSDVPESWDWSSEIPEPSDP